MARAAAQPSTDSRLRTTTLRHFTPLEVTAVEAPEPLELKRLIERGGAHLEHRVAGRTADGHDIVVVALGTRDPSRPAIGFFGGVHGLERIGVQVATSYLRTLVERLRWDKSVERELEHVRIVFMPLVNPGGLLLGTRANPNGVDLMRNAPLDAQEPVPWLLGGQRVSSALPWYRGAPGAPMEAEAQALCRVVEEELLPRPFSLALDCHSGFGMADRIWFPYAHTARPIEHLAEIHALTDIFERSHAHHRYVIEPQSHHYLTHGDLWDWLYRRAEHHADAVFLPLTLEMGSWAWIRKNPRQLFRREGIFNPVIEHRVQRVLRRHVTWLDFLVRAVASHERWRPVGVARDRETAVALHRWYGGRA